MANFINPYELIQPFMQPLSGPMNTGIAQGVELSQLGPRIAATRAQTDVHTLEAEKMRQANQFMKQFLGGGAVPEVGGVPGTVPVSPIGGGTSGMDLSNPTPQDIIGMKHFLGVDLTPKRTVDATIGRVTTTPALGGMPTITDIPGIKPKHTPSWHPSPDPTSSTGYRYVDLSNNVKGEEAPPPRGVTSTEPYKVGHIQPFDVGEGKTLYREYGGRDAQGQAIWKDRPDLGGKSQVKGYDTMEEAFAEAQAILKKTPEDAGLVPSAELSTNNKWIPKLVSNITLRIPPMSGEPTLPPNVFRDRRTGKLVEYVPENNTTRPYNPSTGIQQAAINWQALKKSAQTINGPVFKRLIDNAEILAVGVRDPKTGVMSKPELDQVADLRDKIDDKIFSKISSDLQAFNRWDQWLSYKTSDIPMARLISKVMADTDTLANVYAGGGTVTSDFKMKFAKDLFETALSKEAFRAKMDTHKEAVRERAIKYAEPNPAGVIGGDVPGIGPVELVKPIPGKAGNISLKNSRGWSLHTDARGNKAYVSPDGKQFEEVK